MTPRMDLLSSCLFMVDIATGQRIFLGVRTRRNASISSPPRRITSPWYGSLVGTSTEGMISRYSRRNSNLRRNSLLVIANVDIVSCTIKVVVLNTTSSEPLIRSYSVCDSHLYQSLFRPADAIRLATGRRHCTEVDSPADPCAAVSATAFPGLFPMLPSEECMEADDGDDRSRTPCWYNLMAARPAMGSSCTPGRQLPKTLVLDILRTLFLISLRALVSGCHVRIVSLRALISARNSSTARGSSMTPRRIQGSSKSFLASRALKGSTARVSPIADEVLSK